MERFKRVDFEGFCFVLPGETFEEIEPSTEDEPKPRVCSDWVHSSDFGITRVSDGSRYNDITSPPFQDKTYRAPGRDGVYYFESFYNARQIQVSFAFDHMSETQLRALRKRFDGKNMGELIFDEYPFKAYTVKLQQPLQIKYVCFDEEVGVKEDGITPIFERVYKGEGTINFICYDPFARAVHPYLSQYDEFNYPNISEWAEASGLEIGPSELSGTKLVLYNNGDLNAEFKIYIPLSKLSSGLILNVSLGDKPQYQLNLSGISEVYDGDYFLLIDMERHLLKGATIEKIPTGTIYNRYIQSGEFGSLPISNGEEVIITSSIDWFDDQEDALVKPTNRVIFRSDSFSDLQTYNNTFGFGYGYWKDTTNDWELRGGAHLGDSGFIDGPVTYYFDKNSFVIPTTSTERYFSIYKTKGGSGVGRYLTIYSTGTAAATMATEATALYDSTYLYADSEIDLYGFLRSKQIKIIENETYIIAVTSTSRSAGSSTTVESWNPQNINIPSADNVTSTFKLDYRYF